MTTKISVFLTLSILCIGGLLLSGSVFNDLENEEHAASDRVFEMRTYITHEGKLNDLHDRFSNHTMGLFEKHGMVNIGYWVPQDEEASQNTLIYIIAHESVEAAERSWDAFRNDPEWQEVYEASHADGVIVKEVESIFMDATPYSQIQ
jgi:hypothetical protein